MVSRRFRTTAIIAGGLTVVVVLVGLIALPRVADHLIRARIASLAARAGYRLDYQRMSFSPPDGLHFERLLVTDLEDVPVLSVQKLQIDLNRRALFLGGMPVTGADARGVRLSGHPRLAGITGSVERALWHDGKSLVGTGISITQSEGGAPRVHFAAKRVSGELSHAPVFGGGRSVELAALTVEEGVFHFARAAAQPKAPSHDVGLDAAPERDAGEPRNARRFARLVPHELSLVNVRVAVFDTTPMSDSRRWAEATVTRVWFMRRPAERGTEVRGDVQLDLARMVMPSIADEVIEFAPLRYQFAMVVDGSDPLPPARLVRPLPGIASDAAVVPSGSARVVAEDGAPAPRGSAVTTEGTLQLGDVTMELRPTLRGFSGVLGALFPAAADVEDLPYAHPGRSDGGSVRDHLPARIELQIDLPKTPLSSLHAAIPAALLGDLRTVQLGGRLAWRFDLEAPSDELARMQWRVETQLEDFAVSGLAPSVDVARLTGPFIHRIIDPAVGFDRTVRVPATVRPPVSWLREQSALTDEQISLHRSERTHRTVTSGGYHRFDSGTTLPDPTFRFIPLTQISPWVVRAMITGEDGDFFHHGGVNWNSVRRAIERNVQEGAFVVGASTIPMQLVKNVFLSQDRLMARKLQEVALVFLMEQAAGVSKERILELYLNLIEFGPGVFGIFDAARYYFDKHPRDLTAIESVWLASIVPNPKRFHFYFERGAVTDGWFARMQQYLDVMLLRGRMTEEEYMAALQERPEFVRR
ncbi:MAG: hypothetical protein EA403_14775 [Spirochaetaceae bacterium]|nr:MAG: hypothetical protein EA403_14775 [Spirochaetaceae bacterium]